MNTDRVPVPYGKNKRAYRQLWRIVDGALRSALKEHPEYLNKNASEKTVRVSFAKRIVGALMGFLGETEKHRSTGLGRPVAVDKEGSSPDK